MAKSYTQEEAKVLATKAATNAVAAYVKENKPLAIVGKLDTDPKSYLPASSEGAQGGTYAVTFRAATTTYKRMARGKVLAHIQGLLDSGNEPESVAFEAKEGE